MSLAKFDSTPVSLPAAADLSTKKFYFGKTTATGINVCTVLGERSEGVIGAHYKISGNGVGDPVDFYVDRVVLLEANAAIAVNAELTPAATGRAVTAVAGNIVRAKAIEAAAAAGDYFRAIVVDAYAKP